MKNIAERSRQTPRIANYLLRRVRDYAQMHKSEINEEAVKRAFDMLVCLANLHTQKRQRRKKRRERWKR
jgi:Holliday junction resolvasome RuvABC ATP-dependent DNA helicase subunit